MNRRGFAGTALACVGGFFFPRKVKATTSDEFKFGDCVNLDLPEDWSSSLWRPYIQGYITYVDKSMMIVQTAMMAFSLYFVSGQWHINGNDGICKVSRRESDE